MPYRMSASAPLDESLPARAAAAASKRHGRRVLIALVLFSVAAVSFACIMHASWARRAPSSARSQPLRGRGRLTWFVRPVPASVSFFGAEYCAFEGNGSDCCEVQRGTPFAPVRGATSCVEPR